MAPELIDAVYFGFGFNQIFVCFDNSFSRNNILVRSVRSHIVGAPTWVSDVCLAQPNESTRCLAEAVGNFHIKDDCWHSVARMQQGGHDSQEKIQWSSSTRVHVSGPRRKLKPEKIRKGYSESGRRKGIRGIYKLSK